MGEREGKGLHTQSPERHVSHLTFHKTADQDFLTEGRNSRLIVIQASHVAYL